MVAGDTRSARTFFTHQHPIDGSLSFAATDGVVVIRCRWPFDRSTDEWIEMSNDFDLDAYTKGIGALKSAGTTEVIGRRGGHLRIRTLQPGSLEVDLVEAAAQAPTRFFVTIDAQPEALLPVV